MWPRHTESSNTGKINHQGKLITGPEDIKKLLAKEFSERLWPRPYHPNFNDIKMIKEEAFEVKLNQAKLNKSPDWNTKDVDIVLKNINQNKSRDPEGLNRSIFHENCIGSNLKKSFLIMANKLKQSGFIPTFMKQATISPIPKAGSKFVLKNERGIFVLSAIRTLFMRLIYNTKSNIIEDNMSDSNVGGRKKISSLNHIFIKN